MAGDNTCHGRNGQERDDDVSGVGNTNTATFWEYDTRIGRRWNRDPIIKPYESSYSTFANNPIWFIDPNGADSIFYNKKGSEIASMRIKSESTGYLYEHNSGKFKRNDMTFIPINSAQSIKGHDSYAEGTNDILINNFNTYLIALMIEEDVIDDNSLQLDFKANTNLDIAYMMPGDGGLIDLVAKDGYAYEHKEFDNTGNGRSNPTDYTNALFLLPHGVYGNANEAGNYAIGFAHGLAGVNSSAAGKAELFSKLMNGESDEPWEQRILVASQAHGKYYRYQLLKK